MQDMRRYPMIGALLLVQAATLLPAQAHDDTGNRVTTYGPYDAPPGGTAPAYAPPPTERGKPFPPGQYPYAYPPLQQYPVLPYPEPTLSTQPAPTPPPAPVAAAPTQAPSPDTACPTGRFFDQMTKTCESP